MNRILQPKNTIKPAPHLSGPTKKPAEIINNGLQKPPTPSEAMLCLSQSPLQVIPILLTPFEHDRVFDNNSKSVTVLRPTGKLKCTSEMRKAFLSNFTKSPNIEWFKRMSKKV